MEPLRLGYIAVFALTAILCFAVVPRTRLVSDTDTRRSLVALLVLAGGWATLSTVQVYAETLAVKTGLYTAGLAIGFAAVFAWLAFCSAYAGRTFHRDPTAQAAALGGYLLVISLKFTNPIHGRYFEAVLRSDPFPHLAITRLPVDWAVATVAYLLSAYGFLLLYRSLDTTDYRTRSLWMLIGVAAFPVVPTLLSDFAIVSLLHLNYEPIGVALFAVGALYFVEEKFTSVRHFGRDRLLDEVDDIVLVLDADDRITELNAAARAAFPALVESTGKRLTEVAPRLTKLSPTDEVLTVENGDRRHYVGRSNALSVGSTVVGRLLVLTDVTEIERHRRELERQNRQLDDFASAIDHELRNSLSLIEGYTELAREELDEDTPAREQLGIVERTTEQMVDIVGDLTTLARYGQTLDATMPCSLATVVDEARGRSEADDLSIQVDDATVLGDADRLCELFASVFEFALGNGATTVAVTYHDDLLSVTTDGDHIPPDSVAEAFEYEAAVPSAESGMLLPNVRTLATVHGWEADIDAEYTEGVRLRFAGVEQATA